MKWPFVKLQLALIGHTLSGVYWEQRCSTSPAELGFERVPNWDQRFVHR